MADRDPAMAESTDQPTPPITPETWQWAFSYLRGDVQDIRTDLREVRTRIDETSQQLGARIDETHQQLGSRIDELSRRITTMFTWTIATMLTTFVAMLGAMAALIKL